MDKDRLVRPAAWNKAMLAVLPGAWLVLQQTTRMVRPVFSEAGTFAVTVMVAAGVIWLSLRWEGRIAPWSIPAIGGLLWKVGDGLVWLYWAGRSGWVDWKVVNAIYILVAGSLLVCACVILYRLLRKWWARIRDPGWLQRTASDALAGLTWWWGLLGLLVLITIGQEFRSPLVSLDLAALELLVLLVPVMAGLSLAKHDHLNAPLFVATCQPLWLDVLVRPRYALYEQLNRASSSLNQGGLELGLFVLTYLPLLFFLVVLPLVVLRSRSRITQRKWLVALPLLVLGMSVVTRGLALAGTEWRYSLAVWLWGWLDVVQLWLPLLLAVVPYRVSRSGERISLQLDSQHL